MLAGVANAANALTGALVRFMEVLGLYGVLVRARGLCGASIDLKINGAEYAA